MATAGINGLTTNEDNKKKLLDLLEKLRGVPTEAPPTLPKDDGNFNAGELVGLGVAGLGDAFKSYAGQPGTGVQNLMGYIEKQKNDRRQTIKDYLEQKKSQREEVRAEAALENMINSQQTREKELGLQQKKLETDESIKKTNQELLRESLESKKAAREGVQQERDLRRDDIYSKRQADILFKFNNDPVVKKSNESLNSAKLIQDFITSDNPIAAATIPTIAARMSGEVGNLAEHDKAPFGGSRAILSRLNAALQEKATGKMSEENKKFMMGLTNIMKKRASENKLQLAQNWSKQFSQIPNYGDEKTIFGFLAPELITDESSTVQPNTSQTNEALPKVGEMYNGSKVKSVTKIK